VVRLPHGADGVVDQLSGLLTTDGSARDEIPEAGAEVGPTEDGIGSDGEEEHDGDRGAHTVTTSSASCLSPVVGPLGPYGTSCSLTPRWRNRLLILRRMRTVVTPSPMYRTVTRMKVTQTPVFAVAASSTFMML